MIFLMVLAAGCEETGGELPEGEDRVDALWKHQNLQPAIKAIQECQSRIKRVMPELPVNSSREYILGLVMPNGISGPVPSERDANRYANKTLDSLNRSPLLNCKLAG